MAKSKFRPLHDRVVVKWIDAEEKTKGGIIIPEALVRTGLTPHNLPADCSNDRADECSTWTNSSKAAISIAK